MTGRRRSSQSTTPARSTRRVNREPQADTPIGRRVTRSSSRHETIIISEDEDEYNHPLDTPHRAAFERAASELSNVSLHSPALERRRRRTVGEGAAVEDSELSPVSPRTSTLRSSARQSQVLDGRRRASSREAEDGPRFGSRQLKRRREDTSEEPEEGEWRVHMRQRRRRMLPRSAEIETDLDSVGEPEADEDPRRSPRDQGTTLFEGRDASAFLVERRATLQSYLRAAVLENTARYNRIESDESTYERWTRKMIGELLPHCHFPVTNLDTERAWADVELFVGNNADVKDMLSTTNPVPRGIPLLIQGDLKYPFDDEFGAGPLEQFLGEFQDRMEVQVQNLGRKYWHSSFETLSMREFRRHVLGIRRIRGRTLEALDLPFITGGADLAVPDFLKTYRDAWFLHDIDAHINTHGQVWYPNEEEPRWEGSVVASRVSLGTNPRSDGIQTWGDKNKFALVADGGAVTGVHEHALGMGTWVTVCEGSFLWCWLNPSEVTEEQKVSVYDTIDRHGRPLRRDLPWRAVVLQPGDTFVMFPGTMHAVVRTKTERSLMFSGHLLFRSSLSTWIDVVMLQLQHKGACNESPGERARQVLAIVWEVLEQAVNNHGGGLRADDFGGIGDLRMVLAKLNDAFQLLDDLDAASESADGERPREDLNEMADFITSSSE